MRKRQLIDSLGRACKHGMTHSPEYKTWIRMKARCSNPNGKRWDRYGGRGIAVCRRWRESFEDFYEDIGDKPSHLHSIERIDNDKGYLCGRCDECLSRGEVKTNCKWATKDEQNRNRCDNVHLDHDGLRLTVSEWAKKLGCNKKTLLCRLDAGWTVESVLATPVLKHRFLSDAEAADMRAKYALGVPRKVLADSFGVCLGTVDKIVNLQTRKGIDKTDDAVRRLATAIAASVSKLTGDDLVEQIVQILTNGRGPRYVPSAEETRDVAS